MFSQCRPRRKRIGRVSYYFISTTAAWWVYYKDGDRQVRRRTDRTNRSPNSLRQLNAQLTSSAPTMFSFVPLTVSELCQRFLDHHEHVLRSSLATVRRFRTAIKHLEDFATRSGGQTPAHNNDSDRFVCYLRTIDVAPNGHKNAARRKLRDKGVLFILEVCRNLYAFAARKRHLPPYAENPFSPHPKPRIPIMLRRMRRESLLSFRQCLRLVVQQLQHHHRAIEREGMSARTGGNDGKRPGDRGRHEPMGETAEGLLSGADAIGEISLMKTQMTAPWPKPWAATTAPPAVAAP